MQAIDNPALAEVANEVRAKLKRVVESLVAREKRMSAFRKSMIAASFLLALAGGAYAASDWLTGSTEQQLKTLAAIQPGLGHGDDRVR